MLGKPQLTCVGENFTDTYIEKKTNFKCTDNTTGPRTRLGINREAARFEKVSRSRVYPTLPRSTSDMLDALVVDTIYYSPLLSVANFRSWRARGFPPPCAQNASPYTLDTFSESMRTRMQRFRTNVGANLPTVSTYH